MRQGQRWTVYLVIALAATTAMGTPSASEPWGFQLDGHHAIVNYVVLGDQVVMTPFFAGSDAQHPHTAEFGAAVR